MKEPPNEEIPIPFFRTGKNHINTVSLYVYHTIQNIKNRQDWLTNYLQKKGHPDLDFVGKYKDNSEYKEIAYDIRKTLKLKIDWASKQKNWEQALEYISAQIEEIGVLINFNGIVGNSTNRKILVE